ncbi:hypothetical protein DL764_004193 [Monosporascus ibericus]|uniref:Uncharacterized protein n=1 Tax=Monosporascus ibericus TaxID=155417 RepID=A0A4Q4TH63_9PEZI|nr:hypothetical protein DL764_004193 [Monosporascus ibericus]
MAITYNPALSEFWIMHYFELYPPSVMTAAANNCFGYSPFHESAITMDHWQAYISNNGPESAPSSSSCTTEPTHKPRDKDFDGKVKAAAIEYRQRDRDFMLGLDEHDRSVMATSYLGSEVSNTESAMQRRDYLKIFWTLKGAKPCFLSWREQSEANKITSRRVYECLGPVSVKYQLEDHGFRLIYMYDSVDSGSFRGGRLFADILSPEWDRVRDAFLVGPVWGRLGSVPELEIAHALGYRVAEDAVTDLHIVVYSDNTEMRAVAPAGSGEFRLLQVLSFCCTGTEFENRGRNLDHFKRYKELVIELGADLKFVPVGKLPEDREVLEEIMARLTVDDLD